MEVLLTRADDVGPGGRGGAAARRARGGGHAVAGRVGGPVPDGEGARRSWPACWRPWSRPASAVTQFREVQTDLEEAFMTVAQGRRGRPAAASGPGGSPMNPIVRRELLELLRTRKAVAAQVGPGRGLRPAASWSAGRPAGSAT